MEIMDIEIGLSTVGNVKDETKSSVMTNEGRVEVEQIFGGNGMLH